jgi:hypothetical protein
MEDIGASAEANDERRMWIALQQNNLSQAGKALIFLGLSAKF